MVTAYWLLKVEPSTYSFEDLCRDGRTVWDGVTNPVALKNIRSARAGDRAVVYHTGNEKRAVGIAEVATDAYPDPKDPKLTVFDLVPRGVLSAPVTLGTLKRMVEFKESPLVTQGRLSVVPLTRAQWMKIMAMAGQKESR